MTFVISVKLLLYLTFTIVYILEITELTHSFENAFIKKVIVIYNVKHKGFPVLLSRVS